jgi:hypothetical protein
MQYTVFRGGEGMLERSAAPMTVVARVREHAGGPRALAHGALKVAVRLHARGPGPTFSTLSGVHGP